MWTVFWIFCPPPPLWTIGKPPSHVHVHIHILWMIPKRKLWYELSEFSINSLGPVCKLLWAPKHKVGMGSHQDYLYILCWQQLEAATDYHYQPLWRDLIWHSYSSYNTLHYSCSQMNWFLMNWLLNLGGVYSNGNLVMAFFTSYVTPVSVCQKG